MARTVSVILQAEVSQYLAGMSKAALATKGVGDTAETSSAKAAKHFDLAGKGAMLMGTAVAGALVGIVMKSMDFEKSMSAVQAATQASVGTLGDLRAAAIKAGADTQYSATEAADAITEMGKAGVSAKDIMGGGLKGALSLAAAGQLDVASAAGIASTAMTQFSLSGKDLPHVADLLAAGAGKAMGSVDDLGQALNQAGLLASSTGISIEETTGTLAAFASAGLIGSDAGTSFKTMLQQLQAPSKQAQALMDGLGIAAYDAQGKFVGLGGLAQQLKSHLSGLTQAQRDNALATIFGTDAARAATVLYREGATGIADWTAKVNDAGYAAKQAHDLNDNLAGDLERLGGSFDTLLISIGTGLQGPLRGLTQMLGGLVDGTGSAIKMFGDLPGPIQAAVLGFGAWAVAGGKVMGAVDGIRTRLVTLREEQELQRGLLAMQNSTLSDSERALGGLGTELDRVNIKASTARAAIGGFARAIGPELVTAGGVLLISEIVSEFGDIGKEGQQARQDIEEFNASLKQIGGNADRLSSVDSGIEAFRGKLQAAQKVVNDFNNQGFFNKYVWQNPFSNDYYEGVDNAQAAVKRYRSELEQLETKHKNAEASTSALSEKYGIASSAVLELADKYRIDLSQGLSNVQGQFVSSGAAAEIATGAITSVGNAAGMTQAQIEAASKAQEDWLTELQKIATGFVDPLNTYKTLLSDKQAAEQQSAQDTADATASSKDSWKDYVKDVTVSLSEYATKLEEEIQAHENWRANIATVTARGGLEVGQILTSMGVEGAQITAQMATATGADFERMKSDLITQSHLAGSGAAAEMDTQMKVLAAAAASGGQLSVQGLAAQLGLGVGVVAGIVAQYNATLAGGINPILMSLGKPTIAGYHVAGINGPGGTQTKASGGYISGPGSGTSDSIPARLSNGEFVVRASQTAKHLPLLHAINAGMPGYAGGGFVSSASVPKPYSTAPYGVPISTAGDATMGKGYDETTAWLKAQQTFSGGGGGAGSPLIRALGQNIAAAMGYASQFAAIDFIFSHESGWNPNAQNPTSSAYGIPQMINSTWAAYGGKTSDPSRQIRAGIQYMADRYGSPNQAAGFWQAHHYYAKGGPILEPVEGIGMNTGDRYTFGERGPEMVVPMSREMSGSGPVGGGTGAVNVNITGARITGTVAFDPSGVLRFVDARIDEAQTALHDRYLYSGVG